MKKALSLFLVLVMICSVVATLSTVSAANTNLKAAPVLDGVISDGEYTYSVTTNVDDLSSGASYEIQGTEVVEYFAYNATYLYYGIVFTQTADNRACWPQFKVNNTFNVYSNESGTLEYYHSRANFQTRYLADGTTRVVNIGAPMGGTTPVFEQDMFVNAAKDENYVKTYEFKFALSYIAENAGCEAEDVRVVPYWTYFHASTSTAHNLTYEDMQRFGEEGIGEIEDVDVNTTMYHFIVLDSTPQDEKYENLANDLGLTYYVGDAVAEEIENEEEEEEDNPCAFVNLEDLYGATYVGAALGENDDKPVLDGVINDGEYQVEYVVDADGAVDTARHGAPTELLGDFKQYVAHDDEYIYAAFDFYNASTSLRGRFYWNLSFIDSFDVQYYGGNTVNDAFKQNDHGIVDGWNFGAEVKPNIEDGYSDRNNAVSFGTVPVKGTDFDVVIAKEDHPSDADISGYTTTHQIYEFKVSKAWYAAQVGLESAADVRELAWVTLAQEINTNCSSYTQIGHYLSDTECEYLEETYGASYTRPTVASYPYDNAMLPLLFVLDDGTNGDDSDTENNPGTINDPWEELTNDYGLNVYIGKATDNSPVIDGVISEGEYSYSRVIPLEELSGYETGEIQGDLEEFFAHDENYIYIGARFEQANDNRAYWIHWKPTNTFDIYRDRSDLTTYYYNRVSAGLRYQTDGSITVSPTLRWFNDIGKPLPTIGTYGNEEYHYAATKDENNIKTYEVRIAKSYIAAISGCSVDEVRVMPYWTMFHANIQHGAPMTEEFCAAVSAFDNTTYVPSGDARTYWFLVLDEEPTSHSWDEGVVMVEPTHLTTGSRKYTCAICGETRLLDIPKTPEHTYGDWHRYNEEEHQKECVCGESDYAEHNWDNGVVAVEPTHFTKGVQKFTCTDCSETKLVDIPRIEEHTYTRWFAYGWGHYAVCECGYSELVEHEFDEGVITTLPTHLTEGVKTYTCICGETYTELVPNLTPHEYGSWGKHNATQHIRFCPCGAFEYADHHWDAGVVTIPATHEANGLKTFTCTDCGETRTEAVTKIDHTFGEWTKYNIHEHKHVCACGAVEYAAHVWGEGVVTTEATHLTEGVKTYTCADCGETKTEAIAKVAAHTFGEWTKYNIHEHKKTCACGAVEYAAHVWGDGVVTTEATHLTEGVKTYTCADCGETKTEVIAKTSAHTFGEWTKYNVHEHKKTCACGAVEYAAHVWGEGVVTTEATHLTEGVKTYTCADCGETKTEVIAKTSAHTFGEWTKYNIHEHKHVCACGAVEYAAHVWGEGVVTTEATHLTEGVKTYTCADCGETKTEAIAKVAEHKYGEWGKHNATQHAHFCDCGGVEYADHVWGEGVITLDPTTKTSGIKTYTCADCGEIKTELIDKLPADAEAGCESFVGSGLAVMGVVTALGAAFVTRRKEER